MRALIRPTLFMIARLGLFLTVTAWFVSQWWQVQLGDLSSTIGISSLGWFYFGFAEVPREVLLDVAPSPEVLLQQIMFASGWGPDQPRSFLGITVKSGPLYSINMRHELVVAIFAVFNAMLMRVYRKKTPILSQLERQACNAK